MRESIGRMHATECRLVISQMASDDTILPVDFTNLQGNTRPSVVALSNQEAGEGGGGAVAQGGHLEEAISCRLSGPYRNCFVTDESM